MGILVDWQIEEFCQKQELITPFSRKQLQPASYDVRIQNVIKQQSDKADHVFLDRELPVALEPNEFILAAIQEKIMLPDDMTAQFYLKSSRAREGYEHALATWADPGYEGNMTLELKNNSRNPLTIPRDLMIGQLVFQRTEAPCRTSYAKKGRYMNDVGPTKSRG